MNKYRLVYSIRAEIEFDVEAPNFVRAKEEAERMIRTHDYYSEDASFDGTGQLVKAEKADPLDLVYSPMIPVCIIPKHLGKGGIGK